MPRERLGDLVAASDWTEETKLRRFLGFIPISVTERKDPFWDFLRETATEPSLFGYSGVAFCDLEEFLTKADQKGLFDLALSEPTKRISEIRSSSKAVFDHNSCRAVLYTLAAVDHSEQAIRRFYGCERPEDDEDEMVKPLLAAFLQAKEWMAAVEESKVGLLSLIVGPELFINLRKGSLKDPTPPSDCEQLCQSGFGSG